MHIAKHIYRTMSMKAYLLLIVPTVLLQLSCGNPKGTEISIVSYNVKAGFEDTQRTDSLPERISLAMREIKGGTPDILLLQEVENRLVIDELLKYHLIASGYRHRIMSPNSDGILRLSIVSRYPLVSPRFHQVNHYAVPSSRGFLEVGVDIHGLTLYIFHAHLKSKRGGSAETEPQRIATFNAIARRARKLEQNNRRIAFIIAGDLNAQIESAHYPTALVPYDADDTQNESVLIADITDADDLPTPETLYLITPWSDSSWPGSYYYNEWEKIDHFLLSRSLFDGHQLEYTAFTAVASDALLNEKGLPSHNFSDHLPILLQLRIVNSDM